MFHLFSLVQFVATVPTVYGIETSSKKNLPNSAFTSLQQYLPFTVLKLRRSKHKKDFDMFVATVPTVYGIETDCRSIT